MSIDIRFICDLLKGCFPIKPGSCRRILQVTKCYQKSNDTIYLRTHLFKYSRYFNDANWLKK
jgi:hypothetical protein